MRSFFYFTLLWVVASFSAAGADWVRAGLNTNAAVWGLKGGLQFAIAPAGFRPPEPRGLIRLGSPILPGGRYDLVNFIAVEPVVTGKKGFSELERSQRDQRAGKAIDAVGNSEAPLAPGALSVGADGVEQLTVGLQVEKFENGAHVRLLVLQSSAAPDEIRFRLEPEPDSAPMDYCILTATMGNMARVRELWLRNEVVSSRKLYPDYRASAFAPHNFYPLDRLFKNGEGDVLVAVTTDEADPAAVYPYPNSESWHYAGAPVTQFWKKPKGTFRDDLQAVVNARFTYWMSQRPVPGGIAYENFELRERFYPGQEFVFGITPRTPQALGFKSQPPR